MRPSRKLRNLNVWQQGIEQHRAAQRRGSSGSGLAAPGGWAKAFFRRLLGRRAAAARQDASLLVSQPPPAAPEVTPAVAQHGGAGTELREGMLSRRAFPLPGQSASPPRMADAGAINIAVCRDLRIWQRGKEFVAAARGGFDTGAGPEHAVQRRAYWRQRSQRRSAAASPPKAAQSLRLLLRTLAARQGRDKISEAGLGAGSAGAPSAGTVFVGGKSRKTAHKKLPQPIAAAAGMRRNKSFRDHQFRQQGLGLLEKALRAKKPGS